MNPFEMVVLIVAIVTVGRLVASRRQEAQSKGDQDHVAPSTLHMEKQIADLHNRVQVLERILTDRGSSLANEIESLRDR